MVTGSRLCSLVLGFALCLLQALVTTPAAMAQCPSAWLPGDRFLAIEGTVHATAYFDPDGPGTSPARLVIGGEFTVPANPTLGTPAVSNLAQWDGTYWRALAGQSPNAPVRALKVVGSQLYVGGDFSQVGTLGSRGIAIWSGSSWSPLGFNTLDGVFSVGIRAIEVHNGTVYLAGEARTSDINATPFSAVWTRGPRPPFGTGWLVVSFVEGLPQALTSWNGSLYCGGKFSNIGGVAAANIAKWAGPGNPWVALGSGVAAPSNPTAAEVKAMHVWQGALWVGGYMTETGGLANIHLARYDGTNWTQVSNIFGNGVSAFATYNNNLICSADGLSFGGASANRIAQFDGSQWSRLAWSDPGLTGPANTLIVTDIGLYAGGTFGLKQFPGDSSGWQSKGMGMFGNFYAFTTFNGRLIGGGSFGWPGGSSSLNNVGWFDGSVWQPMGNGFNGQVYALEVHNGELYAAGAFTASGSTPILRVAKWTGSQWVQAGLGMNGPVNCLKSYGPHLYAGGSFLTIPGSFSDVGGIARFDGTNWSAFTIGPRGCTNCGQGSTGTVFDMTVWNNQLIVAGNFIYVDHYQGTPPPYSSRTLSQHVAAWDGTGWKSMGGGSIYWVYTVEPFNGDLYAGGDIGVIGGTPSGTIAKWNGTAWSTLGGHAPGATFSSGIFPLVLDMHAMNGVLYVGGTFTGITSLGIESNSLLKWDGATWSGVGSGMYGGVSAFGSLSWDQLVTNGSPNVPGWAGNYTWSRLWLNQRPQITTSQTTEITIEHGGSFALNAFPYRDTNPNTIGHVNWYQWSKDGMGNLPEGGNQNTGAGYVGTNTSSLFVSNASYEEGGEYTLLASTECGFDSVQIYVNVVAPRCKADLSGPAGVPDGGVDIADLLFFLSAFEQGDLAADLDDDGDSTYGDPDDGVDIADLLFFLARFEAGC